MSIRYLVPDQVVQYIENNNLFEEDGASSTASDKSKGKDKERKAGESSGVAAAGAST